MKLIKGLKKGDRFISPRLEGRVPGLLLSIAVTSNSDITSRPTPGNKKREMKKRERVHIKQHVTAAEQRQQD